MNARQSENRDRGTKLISDSNEGLLKNIVLKKSAKPIDNLCRYNIAMFIKIDL